VPILVLARDRRGIQAHMVFLLVFVRVCFRGQGGDHGEGVEVHCEEASVGTVARPPGLARYALRIFLTPRIPCLALFCVVLCCI
jgi:hypothetical protein